MQTICRLAKHSRTKRRHVIMRETVEKEEWLFSRQKGFLFPVIQKNFRANTAIDV
jgi:hypothetical protein